MGLLQGEVLMGFLLLKLNRESEPRALPARAGELNLPGADISACVLLETSSKQATQERNNLESKQHRCQLKSQDDTALREVGEQ